MAIILTIGGKPTLHPQEAARAASEYSTPLDFWQRANSYSCPLGPEPGSAWVLMKRRDLDKLSGNAFHEFKWIDGKRTLTIPSLVIVRALTMNQALAGDVKAARLVELQDRRRIFRMSSVNQQYNVRRPAPNVTSGSRLYYEESLNGDQIDGGTIWTWQEIVDHLWGRLPGTTTAPTLPYTPDGTPEDFRFIGKNAWLSLHCVLKAIGCTTAYNPLSDTFSYVRLGTTQTGLAASLSGLSKRLMYDYDPGADFNLSDMPEIVRVFFHRQELYHGTELDTTDTDNWEMKPAVFKDYLTGITGAQTGSVQPIWDPLPALFDSTGANTNSAALQTRANEVGANVANRIDVSEERMRRMYSGLETSILPGSEVSEVRWRDYGDEFGLVTEIIRKPPEDECCGIPAVCEELQPPDLARHTHPLWPRLGQPVQVDDGSSTTGAQLTANASGLFPGCVRRWADGAWTTLDMCWIRPVDLEGADSPSEATIVKLRQKDTLLGRLSGSETVSGDTRPVYLTRLGGDGWHIIEGFSAGTDGQETLFEFETLKITGDSETTASLGDIIDITISKATTVVTVAIDAKGDMFAFRDDDSPQATENVALGEVIDLAGDIDEALTSKFTEWRVTASTLTLYFGKVFDVTGNSGSVDIFPLETLNIVGSGLANVVVSKATDTVSATISISGTLFTITDEQSPTPGTCNIDVGDDLDISTSIDETQTTIWAQFKVTDVASDPAIDLVFGKVFDCTGDTGSEDIFPLETLEILGSGGASVAVSKTLNTVTYTITAGGGGASTWDLRDDTGPTTTTISDTEIVQFTATIDETQNSVWAEWNLTAGAPNDMEISFGRMLVIEGHSTGTDGTANLYPTETVVFRGDRDVSAVLGNIIDITISKTLDDVFVDVDATGDMFQIDGDSGSVLVALGEVIDFTASIDETQTTQFAQIICTGNNIIARFGKLLDITDDQASPNTEIIYPIEEIKFKSTPANGFTVTKLANTVTVALEQDTTRGIIMDWKAPILSGGKYYQDDGVGAANTDWALMDGISNITPGSGIEMWDRGGAGSDPYFVRARDALTVANNTAAGRAVAATPDDDEVTVSINDHPDHRHAVDADACDDDTGSVFFKFSVANKLTGIQVASPGGGALTLDHTVTITNPDGSGGSATDGAFEMTPPHKKLHFFERVA